MATTKRQTTNHPHQRPVRQHDRGGDAHGPRPQGHQPVVQRGPYPGSYQDAARLKSRHIPIRALSMPVTSPRRSRSSRRWSPPAKAARSRNCATGSPSSRPRSRSPSPWPRGDDDRDPAHDRARRPDGGDQTSRPFTGWIKVQPSGSFQAGVPTVPGSGKQRTATFTVRAEAQQWISLHRGAARLASHALPDPYEFMGDRRSAAVTTTRGRQCARPRRP